MRPTNTGWVNGTRSCGRNGPATASQTRQTRMGRGGRSGPSERKAAMLRGASGTTKVVTGVASKVATGVGRAAAAQQDAQALQEALWIAGTLATWLAPSVALAETSYVCESTGAASSWLCGAVASAEWA